MSQPDPAGRPPVGAAPTIGRADATGVAIASAIAAGSSTLIVAGAPRVLGDTAETTVFLTFWSALFVCFGLLSGISLETTRAVTATTTHGAAGARRTASVGTVGACVGVLVGALVAAAAPLWGPAVFPRAALPFALLVALGVAGYAVHSVLVGALAGTQRWAVYSRLIAADSAVRLLLVAAVAVTTGSVVGAGAGAVAAAFTWAALLLLSPASRAAFSTRADVPLGAYLRRLGAASAATGASALLVVGFPTLLAVTTPTAEYALAAPLILALTLTRAPLMIPLNAYQGVAVAHVVRHRDRGLRALLPVARAVVAVGAVGAVAAWAVGPWLLALVGDSPDYRLGGAVLAGLTLGATGLALLTLTGAVCQALARHGAFLGGWAVAVGVALVVLVLPLPLESRAVVALVVAPLVGIGVHLLALRRPPGPADGVQSPPSPPQELA
ncbi:hypothetical protein [Cellulomonas telluris]|uniref:hypothetical protein n=1 Tax=Cellulomonas telluris TaxID=2306636 RepID=UPI0010A775F5|nr:hypothetical protein [Cellulomonas telluris]